MTKRACEFNHTFGNVDGPFGERLGDQVITGPTHTNVNDFRATLVAP